MTLPPPPGPGPSRRERLASRAWTWPLAALAAAALAAMASGSSEGLAWHLGATAIGFAAGLMGGLVAGAIGLMAIPLLVLGLGLPIHQAAATNLVQTAATAGVGAWRHWRVALLDVRNASHVVLGSLVGAPSGSWVALRLPADGLALVLVGALLAGAAAMGWGAWRHKAKVPATAAPEGGGVPPPAPRARALRGVALGVGLGFASGLLGVGAGFLVTPSLAAGLGLPLHLAIGTGLAVIAGNSALASLPHLPAGNVHWLAAGFLAFGGALGVRLGAHLGRRADERLLRAGMAVVLAAAAVSLRTIPRLP